MKLVGLRVLDLSSFIHGPFLTLALVDHGADVIKVEPPGGDPARAIGPDEGHSTIFFRNYNGGKRSIVLDLKRRSDLERCLELAAVADVFIESWRPGVAARLGVGHERICAVNPGIVYCSISALGQSGPDSAQAAQDLSIEARSGVLSSNLGRDGRPALPALPMADLLAGMQGLAAVLMALIARKRTGRGDCIDISMHEALVAGMLNVLGPTLAENRQPIPSDERSTGGSAFYRIYDLVDGRQIVLGGQESKFVERLLGALDRPDLIPFCKAGPGPHQRPVVDFLSGHFGRMNLAEATALLTPLDVCWSPVNSMVEALEDPQLLTRGFLVREPDGRRHIAPPIRFRNEPARPSLDAPALGQHNGCGWLPRRECDGWNN